MLRRIFILFACGCSLAFPRLSFAEAKQKIPKVVIFDLVPNDPEVGLRRGLIELGYVDQKNILISSRYADGNSDRLPEVAAEILANQVDIIASGTTPAIDAIRQLNPSIPIVMTATSDPIGSGLVNSLARPGSTTGMTLLSTDVAAKRLQMLKEAVPTLKRVAVLAYKNQPPTALLFKEIDAAAKTMGLELLLLDVYPNEIEKAFDEMRSWGAGGVVIQQTTALNPYRQKIADLAISNNLPTIHEMQAFPKLGGLMAYGANPIELGRRAAVFVDKILKGSKPNDLPVEQPIKFDLILNSKTAKSLGVTFPSSLMDSADYIID